MSSGKEEESDLWILLYVLLVKKPGSNNGLEFSCSVAWCQALNMQMLGLAYTVGV